MWAGHIFLCPSPWEMLGLAWWMLPSGRCPNPRMTGAPMFRGMECLLEGHCASGWGEEESDAALELACKKWGAKVRGLKT